MANFDAERLLISGGFWPVAGVDEAGRGPLAGPVSAAAVILDPEDIPDGLNDSKVLSARRREILFEQILTRAISISVSFVTAEEIDRINIRRATHVAMCRAIGALSIPAKYALIDGNDFPLNLMCEGHTIVKGDSSSFSIAAASIVAKVMRDRAMSRLHERFPQYGFLDHSGYGTPSHLRALTAFGPCVSHRKSFAPMRNATIPSLR